MSNDKGKQAAGYKAAELVQPNMKVGLGTGSTAYYFIEKLIERCQKGLKIKAIATSKESTKQAQEGGIELFDPDQFDQLDIDVDGADEIDTSLQMIKGGGGALFREKIIARSSKKMIVVVDSSKWVQKLGKHFLPIEISCFGLASILKAFESLNLKGQIRMKHSERYITDNGNAIFDAQIENYSGCYRKLDAQLKNIAGVIETGFFWDLATHVFIGFPDGHVEEKGKL